MGDSTAFDSLVDRLTGEGLIGLAAASRICGGYRADTRTHPSTISRWCRGGAKRADGVIVRLEHIHMPGGRLATSRPAVLRFLAALQQPTPPADPSPARSPAARRREDAAAAAELDRLGIR